MKKSIIAGLVLGAAAAFCMLTGCQEKTEPAPAPVAKTAAADSPVPREKVSVAFWGVDLQAHHAQYLCETFPEVDFEFVLATNSTDYYRYRAEHGDLPDIMTIRRFSLKDALVLKDRLYDLGNTKLAAGYYGSYLENYTYADGTVNWLPACAEADSLIVNASLFEEKDIAVPHDWPSFKAAVKRFEGTGVRGFSADFFSDYNCMELLQGFGISQLTSMAGREWRRRYESGEEKTLSRDVWMPVFERFFELKEAAGFGPSDVGVRNMDVKNRFGLGETAVYRGTGADLGNIPARPGDRTVLLPYFADEAEKNCYLTYPAFQAAVSAKGMKNPEREALILRILTAMLGQEGQYSISKGRNMVPYSRDVDIGLPEGLENLKDAIADNRMYIRLASNEMFSVSRSVVQRILKGELGTPEAAFEAFNEALLKKPDGASAGTAVIERGWPTEFDPVHGNRAASAIFNTARKEAGTDLMIAQASYASPVYAGTYAAKDVRYLTKNDYCWPIFVNLTGEQVRTVVDELLRKKGRYGSVSSRSTLYVSSGFEMHVEEKNGAFVLKDLTIGGRPMDPKAVYSVYILGEGEQTLPAVFKKAGVTAYENARVHTNDYLVRRLLEKGGRLEEPTDYIVLK